MRFILIILISILAGCGLKPEEKEARAIDLAQTYLTSYECQKAIDILEESGRSTTNAYYLQVLSSAYACRAGHSEISFIAEDIPLLQTGGSDFLASLTLFHLSDETEADSDSYSDLKEALNIILNSGGSTQPSQATRNTFFGDRKSGDLGLQALYVSMVQFGKFLNYYGHVDSQGNKGEGGEAHGSTCFINYTGDAAVYIERPENFGGRCRSGSRVNHPDLDLGAGNIITTRRRLCEGLVLLTNIMDILNNIAVPANSSLGSLGDVAGAIDTFKNTALAFDSTLETLLSTTSQSVCEDLVATNAEFDRLQKIYAFLFETGLP